MSFKFTEHVFSTILQIQLSFSHHDEEKRG